MAPKKAKKEPLVTMLATISDDCVEGRHYILNNHPECVSFWSLTSMLHLMKESELISLIRVTVDDTITMKCNGCCTTKVTSNYSRGRGTTTQTVKSPKCEDECLVLIKRII